MNAGEQEKSIGHNFIFNIVKTLTCILFPMITFIYASRILSVEGIGKVNFVKSIIAYFSMFAQMGMVSYGTREAAKIRNNQEKLSKFVQEMMMINLCSTAIAYIVFFCCLKYVSQLFEYRQLLLIYSLTVFLNAFGLEWLYSAMEEYKYMAKRTVMFQLLSLVLLFLLVRDAEDIAWYVFILVFSASGSCVINFFHARRIVLLYRRKHYEIKKHIKPILILFAFLASISIYATLDISMLGFISGDLAVGFYTAGEKANKLVNTVITALGAVLMPRLSYYWEIGKNKEFYGLVNKAYKLTFLIAIPAFVGLFMLSGEIIQLFCGSSFYQAKITMRILTPIVLLIPFSVLTNNQILIPLRMEKRILISTCIGASVNLLCNSLLIPKFKENGAAVGTVIAETAVMLVCVYNAKHFFNIRRIFKGIWKYWFAAIPIVIIKTALGILDLGTIPTVVFTTILGAGIYFGILCIWKDPFALELIKRALELLMKKRRSI